MNERITQIAEKSIDAIYRWIPRPKITSDEWRSSRIVAHRGCHDSGRTIYENTFAAFDAACEFGSWGIEFDVQWTRDSVPVVIHDPDTSRLPGTASVEVAQVDFLELRRFCPLVPRLDEVLERYTGKTHLMIELKAETMNSKYNRQLKESLFSCRPIEDYHLMSLSSEVLRLIHNFPDQVKLPIATTNTREMYAEFRKGEFGGFNGHYLLLDQRIRTELAARNIPWGTGIVNSINVLAREIRSGTTWVFSDSAEMFARAMHRSNR